MDPAPTAPVASAAAATATAVSPRATPLPAGLVGRLAGGTLALVVLGTAVVGLVLGTRTARLYARFEVQVGEVARAELAARLHAITQEIAQRAARADDDDDWEPLQAWLPARAARDPELQALFITDADGLVVADADRSHNGRPLADQRLRGLLHGRDLPAVEVTLDGKPALVVIERVSTPDRVVRFAWAIGNAARARDARLAVSQAGHDAQRLGWVLVALGGVIVAVMTLGVVVVVGGSIARRLQTVSWRIGQLGRGDGSTHLVVDGPAELYQLGAELELASRRITASEIAIKEQSAAAALGRARLELVDAATKLPDRLAGLEVARGLPPLPRGTALGLAPRDRGALMWMVEVVGDRLDSLFAAGALSAAAAAHARRDPGLSPSALLSRLDGEVVPGGRARALCLEIKEGGVVRIASAGARFPLLQRAGGAPVPVVTRGDRVGEPDPIRGAAAELTLEVGDALCLLGEPAASALAAREGHVSHAQVAVLGALPPGASALARAEALVAGPEPAAGMVVALVRNG